MNNKEKITNLQEWQIEANKVDNYMELVRGKQTDLLMKTRNLDYEKVAEKLVVQLKEYLLESKQKWFVIWVSWGIDSATVSTLCAMTWAKIIVMDMPIHQKYDEVNRANEHMNWLQTNFPNVEIYSIDLTETFETFKQALPKVDDEIVRYMAYVNSRSRLRAVTLYAIANENQCVVAGTWNKVEDYGIGFFTKYWDWAVDISPIWNLYKSEVYELAKTLRVNEDILKARPTDWLHPNGATDEDQIWASYDELEWAMVEYDNWKRIDNFDWRKKEVMQIYTNRHLVNAHKMEMPPVFEIE